MTSNTFWRHCQINATRVVLFLFSSVRTMFLIFQPFVVFALLHRSLAQTNTNTNTTNDIQHMFASLRNQFETLRFKITWGQPTNSDVQSFVVFVLVRPSLAQPQTNNNTTNDSQHLCATLLNQFEKCFHTNLRNINPIAQPFVVFTLLGRSIRTKHTKHNELHTTHVCEIDSKRYESKWF